MDLEPILSSYKGGGTSSYHLRMMLKILIYGYVERVHSCREIARAVGERIPFMWLAGAGSARGEGNRSIQFTPALERWKQVMAERMIAVKIKARGILKPKHIEHM